MIVLSIPDLHEPFGHKDAYDFLADIRRKWKPDRIVCQGDESDQHRLSDHEHHPDMPGPKDEYDAMIKRLRIFYKLFPKVEVCISNHTSRPYRKAFSAGLPRLYLKDYRDFMQAPKGWSWHQRILIQNVVYEHGEGVSGKDAAWKAMMQNKRSTVIGHIHAYGGVVYSSDPFSQSFALNSGCLVDPEALAFKYGEKYRNKATLGCGIVIDGVEAYFIRMPV
jgi:hypothetical protein